MQKKITKYKKTKCTVCEDEGHGFLEFFIILKQRTPPFIGKNCPIIEGFRIISRFQKIYICDICFSSDIKFVDSEKGFYVKTIKGEKRIRRYDP